MRIPPDPGSYVLVLRCDIGGGLKVGALGELRLEPGFYLYVGSALGPGGLRARLRHHWCHSARPHWHIDYLRARVELHEIWWSAASQRLEHAWLLPMATCRADHEALLPWRVELEPSGERLTQS